MRPSAAVIAVQSAIEGEPPTRLRCDSSGIASEVDCGRFLRAVVMGFKTFETNLLSAALQRTEVEVKSLSESNSEFFPVNRPSCSVHPPIVTIAWRTADFRLHPPFETNRYADFT